MWMALSIAAAVTVIGIPAASVFLRMALLCAYPFWGELDKRTGNAETINLGLAILWAPFGLLFAVVHTICASILCISLVGAPFAYHHIKLAETAMYPFDRCQEDVYSESIVVYDYASEPLVEPDESPFRARQV